MQNTSIFDGINEKDLNCMLNCFDAKTISFQKDSTIAAYINNSDTIGIIIDGTADIERYDYNGNRSIVEHLEQNSLFGQIFSASDNSEYSVIATSNCKVMFIEYDAMIKRCNKACQYHSIFISNLIKIMSNKIITSNERIEILSSRSIREKLRSFFAYQMKKKMKKTFTIPFSYTDLADYLSVDRSAMMREIKNLKDDGIIKTEGKKITILY